MRSFGRERYFCGRIGVSGKAGVRGALTMRRAMPQTQGANWVGDRPALRRKACGHQPVLPESLAKFVEARQQVPRGEDHLRDRIGRSHRSWGVIGGGERDAYDGSSRSFERFLVGTTTCWEITASTISPRPSSLRLWGRRSRTIPQPGRLPLPNPGRLLSQRRAALRTPHINLDRRQDTTCRGRVAPIRSQADLEQDLCLRPSPSRCGLALWREERR